MVLSYLHGKHLNLAEYYDIVIFGYLKAVQEYTTKMECRVSFQIMAHRKMKDALIKHWQYLDRPMRRGISYSLDAEMVSLNGVGVPFHQYLENPKADTCLTVISLCNCHELLMKMTMEEQKLLKMKYEGYSEIEIAKKCGKKKKEVREYLSKIADLIKKHLQEGSAANESRDFETRFGANGTAI